MTPTKTPDASGGERLKELRRWSPAEHPGGEEGVGMMEMPDGQWVNRADAIAALEQMKRERDELCGQVVIGEENERHLRAELKVADEAMLEQARMHMSQRQRAEQAESALASAREERDRLFDEIVAALQHDIDHDTIAATSGGKAIAVVLNLKAKALAATGTGEKAQISQCPQCGTWINPERECPTCYAEGIASGTGEGGER